MAKHIGIVGCSAEGAALCYRTICLEAPRAMGTYFHPEISMHTHSLGDYMGPIQSGDWPMVAALMLSSVGKLKLAGAEFAICPDNCPLPTLDSTRLLARAAIDYSLK